MKKSYKYLATIALNGMLCLFVALSASAQHRDGGGTSGGGSGSGGGSHPSGGGSPSNSGGGSRPAASSTNSSRPSVSNTSRPGFNGTANRPGNNGISYNRPANGNTRIAIAPPRFNNPNYSITGHRAGINPAANANGGRSYVNTTARSYVGGSGYIGAGGRASVGVGGRGFYGPSYWRNNGYYHYHRGYYNTYYGPRLGFTIGFLPYGYYPFYYDDAEFFYSGGLFYQYDNNEYTVVEPPVGAEVNSLPSNAQSIVINGEQYYEANGVYYEPITKDDGSVTYQVAGKDGELNTSNPNGDVQRAPQVGDIVDALPPDCRKITLNGERYYVSTDGYYYQDARDANNKKVYKIVGTPEDAPQN